MQCDDLLDCAADFVQAETTLTAATLVLCGLVALLFSRLLDGSPRGAWLLCTRVEVRSARYAQFFSHRHAGWCGAAPLPSLLVVWCRRLHDEHGLLRVLLPLSWRPHPPASKLAQYLVLVALLQARLLLAALALLPSQSRTQICSAAAAATVGRLICKVYLDRCWRGHGRLMVRAHREAGRTEHQRIAVALLQGSSDPTLTRIAFRTWREGVKSLEAVAAIGARFSLREAVGVWWRALSVQPPARIALPGALMLAARRVSSREAESARCREIRPLPREIGCFSEMAREMHLKTPGSSLRYHTGLVPSESLSRDEHILRSTALPGKESPNYYSLLFTNPSFPICHTFHSSLYITDTFWASLRIA